MRVSEINRKTNETDISLVLDLDGRGESSIDSGCGFLDHMLTLFARHGRLNMDLRCVGDVQVDYHHTAEDIGIALGQAFKEALADKTGITRYGFMILPMDEALIMTAADISGRGFLGCDLDIKAQKVGDFDTELVKEFWLAFTRESGICLHIRQLAGENAHHIIEAIYKSTARSLKSAVKIDGEYADEIPSTKGVL